MRPHLKIFSGDDDIAIAQQPMVSIPLGEIAQILADASRFKRTWLTDFEDDQIQVPADLFEVLSAYWQLRPGA